MGSKRAAEFVNARGDAVTREREAGWQPEGGGPDPVRWVDPTTLAEARTNPNHWPALVKAGVIPSGVRA